MSRRLLDGRQNSKVRSQGKHADALDGVKRKRFTQSAQTAALVHDVQLLHVPARFVKRNKMFVISILMVCSATAPSGLLMKVAST
jgi:protein gp37